MTLFFLWQDCVWGDEVFQNFHVLCFSRREKRTPKREYFLLVICFGDLLAKFAKSCRG